MNHSFSPPSDFIGYYCQRACINYDHLDNKDVESGEEKLQSRFALDCSGHFLSVLEQEKVLLRSN